MQKALGLKDELDRVAPRAVAARIRRNVVRLVLYLLPRIGHGYRKSALTHDGKIDDIVAHVGNLFERHAFLRHDLAHRLHLERLPHVDKFKLQIARARRHGLADALGDHAAFHPAQTRQRNRRAVVCAVALRLHHGCRVNAEANLPLVL